MSKDKLKIGLFGLGTVGKGFLSIVRESSLPLEVTAIVDRSYKQKKESIRKIEASDDPQLILDNPQIDLVVELMGGVDFPLYVIREALDKKKHVVTANKFLMAEHGFSLFYKASEKNVTLGIEAAVAGALPIIRNLTEIFAYEKIFKLEGILNGTSNYILTVMRRKKKSYREVLAKAQKLGLAEADPTLDLNGADAVHKLALLASLVSSRWSDYHAIETRGIENIRLPDIEWAEKMKYRIRLLAHLERDGENLFVGVEPALISSRHFLWDVEMENNAIYFEGEYSGPHVLMGKGAGMFPTAYSVFSDVASLALNASRQATPIFNPHNGYASLRSGRLKDSCFYLRLEVLDKPGVLSKLANLLAEQNISIATVHQEPNPDSQKEFIDLILLTHVTAREPLFSAIAQMKTLDVVGENLVYLPIYEE